MNACGSLPAIPSSGYHKDGRHENQHRHLFGSGTVDGAKSHPITSIFFISTLEIMWPWLRPVDAL